jgi:hypothetical protein
MGHHPSAWMTELVEGVADCMEAHSPMGPLGWRYHEDEELVELVIYPTPVELVGGAHDGTIVIQDSPWMCRRSRPFSSA